MTKISVISDSPSDKGKSFGGTKIQTPEEYKKSRKKRSRGSSSSKSKTPTKIYIVSDSKADIGRKFGNETIITPAEYNKIRSSNSNVASRSPNASERASIDLQLQKEQEAKKKVEANKLLVQQRREGASRVSSQEQNLRNQLAKTFGPELAQRFKSSKLAELSGLYSSQKKEEQRKELEKFLKASVPRTLDTEAQARSLNAAINKEVKRRKSAQLKLNNAENKALSELIKPTEAQRLKNLELTGQSITPQQRTKLNQIKLLEGDKLNKTQWNSIKNSTLVVPAFNYGRNLVKRKASGESNPFFTDVKEVFREAKAATFDTGYDLGALLGKGTRKSVLGAFNYGKRIQREAQKGNFVLDDDVKFIVNKIVKGTSDAATAGARIASFVKNNPTAAALLVGSVATQGATAFKNKFQKDPVETTLSILLLKGIRIGKVASNTPIGRFILEEKFIVSQPKAIRPYVRAILKGAKAQEKLTPVKVKKLKKINFNEVTELNKVEAKAVADTLKEVDGFVFGSVSSRTVAGKAAPIPKDVDIAVSNKSQFIKKFIANIPKKQRSNYFTKGEKLFHKKRGAIFDIKGYDRLRPDQSIFGTGSLPIYTNVSKKAVVLKPAALEIPTQPLIKVGGIKLVGFGEQTTRKALGTLQVIIEKNANRAKDPAAFITALKLQLKALKGEIPKSKIGKLLTFPKSLKAKQLEESIKILESKQFAKLLDSKVSGLTKQYPILAKKLNAKKLANVDKKSITAKIKDKVKSIKESLKKVTKKKETTKKAASKKKVAGKNKTSKKPAKKATKKKKKPSKVPKKKGKASKVPKKPAKASKIGKAKKKTSKVPKKPSKVKKVGKPPSRVPKAPPKSSKITSGGSKVSRVPKKPSRVSRVPKAPPTTKKTPPTPPKAKFNKKKKSTSGQLRAYRIVFPIYGKKDLVFDNLPFNKAKKKIREFILNKKNNIKSAYLLKRGFTTKKDINKVDLKDFRVAKYQAQNKVGFIVRPKK